MPLIPGALHCTLENQRGKVCYSPPSGCVYSEKRGKNVYPSFLIRTRYADWFIEIQLLPFIDRTWYN